MPFFCFLTVWPHGVEPSNVRLLVFLFCLLVLRSVAESLLHWHTWKPVVWPLNLPKSFTFYRNPNTVPQGCNLMVKWLISFSFIKVLFKFCFFNLFQVPIASVSSLRILPTSAESSMKWASSSTATMTRPSCPWCSTCQPKLGTLLPPTLSLHSFYHKRACL